MRWSWSDYLATPSDVLAAAIQMIERDQIAQAQARSLARMPRR
ncbi:MAG: hypothetical protein NUW22_12580 [Acidobacteria bacterium]|nr:hypothetical protein [Acidobacteriota bacterium]